MKTTLNKYMPVLLVTIILLGWGVVAYGLPVIETVLNDVWDSTSQSFRFSQVASTSGYDVSEETSLTNTVHPLATFTHTTDGTPANDIGLSLDWYQETAAANTELGARTAIVATDTTAASEDFQIDWMLMTAGAVAATKLSLGSTGVLSVTGAVDITGATGLILSNDETITNAVNGTVSVAAISALTNAVDDVLDLNHTTSDTPANGIGVGITATQETTAANNEVIGSIDFVVSDVTLASEDGEIVFSTMTAGAAATEKMRVHDSGEVEFQKGIVPDAVTADPCGSGFPEGSIFYDTTGNVLCFCDGTNDLKISDGSACY